MWLAGRFVGVGIGTDGLDESQGQASILEICNLKYPKIICVFRGQLRKPAVEMGRSENSRRRGDKR
jgi:hypothetical protein